MGVFWGDATNTQPTQKINQNQKTLKQTLKQAIPSIKMIVVLGELGGADEYSLVDALKQVSLCFLF